MSALPVSAGPSDKAKGPVALGFLTVLNEAGGYLGGYLVTNSWGRPLEFRLSSAVQPNRVQQILYGPTLVPYVCADLIGKTLVDRTGVPVHLIVTDRETLLELRRRVEVPVVWLVPPEDPRAASGTPPLLGLPDFPGDVAAAHDLLAATAGILNLAEPFTRIREAIGEARKMGVARSA